MVCEAPISGFLGVSVPSRCFDGERMESLGHESCKDDSVSFWLHLKIMMRGLKLRSRSINKKGHMHERDLRTGNGSTRDWSHDLRKALILARLLGQRINLEDIKADSLYPDDMGPKSMSMDEFMSHDLPLLDRDVGERVEVAVPKENVLRYVCVVDGSRLSASLLWVFLEGLCRATYEWKVFRRVESSRKMMANDWKPFIQESSRRKHNFS